MVWALLYMVGIKKTKEFHPLLSLYEIQVQKQRAGSYLFSCWLGRRWCGHCFKWWEAKKINFTLYCPFMRYRHRSRGQVAISAYVGLGRGWCGHYFKCWEAKKQNNFTIYCPFKSGLV
jgi:hypothetical protein